MVVFFFSGLLVVLHALSCCHVWADDDHDIHDFYDLGLFCFSTLFWINGRVVGVSGRGGKGGSALVRRGVRLLYDRVE